MMKLVGTKRLLALALVLLINATLATLYLLWMEPSKTDANRNLSALTSEISKLRNDIYNIKDEIKRTRENIPFYEMMRVRGFFGEQDRFLADKIIQELRTESDVSRVQYTIEPQISIDDPRAKKADVQFIKSKIKILNIDAYTDVDVFKFLYHMNNAFPGHIRVKDFTVMRIKDITQDGLEGLKKKNNTNYFVRAFADLEWYTLIENAKTDGAALGAGGQP